MRRAEGERGAHVRQRLADVLLRQRVHEIEVHVAEERHRGFGGRCRFVGIVHAPERHELTGREALHAEREAIDAGLAKARELVALEGPRIRFERDLGIGLQRHPRADAREQTIDRRGREQARRAATDEDADHPAAPDAGQRELEVAQQGVDIGTFGQRFRAAADLVRVEVAVRALAQAPRHVHVERERRECGEVRLVRRERDARRPGVHGALLRCGASSGRARAAALRSASMRASSMRMAFPRCETRFLCSSVISAAIRPLSTSRKCGS